MKVLITNDDGVHSTALVHLKDALSEIAEVNVVAPEREASASSHAITVHQPLRMYECTLTDGTEGWAVSGTPADCVILGLLKFGTPDVVVSGINPGANLGDDVTYSGTVGAAFEASLYNINAIAISVIDAENPNYEYAASFLRMFLESSLDSVSSPYLLNINIPPFPDGNVCVTRLGRRLWSSNVQQRIDPRNKPYYWISGIPEEIADEDTDIAAVHDSKISVTPLKLDLTDYEEYGAMRRSFGKMEKY